jgi:hypothetical protein
VTNKERECIREAARRYVREQAPSPPNEVLERVAVIVLQARLSNRPQADLDRSDGRADEPGHASTLRPAYSG